MENRTLKWILPALFVSAAVAPAQENAFLSSFSDKALRFDFVFSGNAREERIDLCRMALEDLWPENPDRLLDPFNNGRYALKLVEVASNTLVYSRGFDCIFGEYRTTGPAVQGETRAFERSLRVPLPRRTVWLVIEARDKANLLAPVFRMRIDPADPAIRREAPDPSDRVFVLEDRGDPKRRVDLVFVAEGYTAGEEEKFQTDAGRFADALFDVEPFRSARPKFSVRAVFRPSAESGVDQPLEGAYRRTALDASFNALGLDRYLLTERNHRLREIAAAAPYDAVVVLANSARYGGGGIYNDYAVSTVDHAASKAVFVHEFGHSFAGLADEYYASSVAYNDFYPKGVEPLEPNITALLDPGRVKWADRLSPGMDVPTEYGKAEIDSLTARIGRLKSERARAVDAHAARNAPAEETQSVKARYDKQVEALKERLEKARTRIAHLEDKVGVFEGAGYASTGLYRPMLHCIMISSPRNAFCRVCEAAIARVIDYHSGE